MTEQSLSTKIDLGRTRPKMPDGYGVPDTDEGMLAWEWVDERLTKAQNYWFSTTRPDGRPHAIPQWAVWLDGVLYFDGSPETRKQRNLAQNPGIVVHLESGSEVVILEGTAEAAPRPEREFAQRLAAVYAEKYGASGYRPSPDTWDNGGLYVVRPQKALAWGEFPTSVTRWTFRDR